jgi:hypothetical protein
MTKIQEMFSMMGFKELPQNRLFYVGINLERKV